MLRWCLLWVLVLQCCCKDGLLCVCEVLLEKLLFQLDELSMVNYVCCQNDLEVVVENYVFVFECVLQLYYILDKWCVEVFDSIVDIWFWVLLQVGMLLILWWQCGWLQVLCLCMEMNMLIFLLVVFVFFVLVCICSQGVFDCVFFVVVWFFFDKVVCCGFLLIFIVF